MVRFEDSLIEGIAAAVTGIVFVRTAYYLMPSPDEISTYMQTLLSISNKELMMGIVYSGMGIYFNWRNEQENF
ncbi:MAG: hypothetical protein ACE5ES_00660 [Candidatus Nanoarchaeia archaeon]